MEEMSCAVGKVYRDDSVMNLACGAFSSPQGEAGHGDRVTSRVHEKQSHTQLRSDRRQMRYVRARPVTRDVKVVFLYFLFLRPVRGTADPRMELFGQRLTR